MRQFVNEKQLFETWAPILQRTTDVNEKDKLTWMSLVAQNQRLFEDRYNNAHVNPDMNVNGMGAIKFPGDPSYTFAFGNQTAGSGDRPYSLLPLAMQVAAQTIGLDLVSVVPMPGPLGMLTYMDFVYAGGRLESKEAPLMIKVKTATTTGGEALFQQGVTFFVNEGSNSTNTFAFTYLGKSRIDNYSIFKVVATETNGTLRQIGDAGNVTVKDAITAGNLYSSAAGTTLVASFESDPDLVKALEDHVPGFVSRSLRLGDGVTNAEEPYLREEGESTPENMMGLTLRTKSVEAQTYQVAAAVTREQVDDLRQYGIDAMAQLESILTNEMTQTINRLILNKMFKMGATSHANWFESQSQNFNINYSLSPRTIYLGAGNDGNPVAGMVTPGLNEPLLNAGENVGSMQRKIYTMILGASNAIQNNTRRGAGNFVVTNAQVVTALQSVAGWVDYPMTNTMSQISGSLYNAGSIAGIQIYVDPYMRWSDTRVLVGRKGDSNSTGLVFMPYLMAQSTSIIAESTMAPKLAVKSRFALVEAGHYPEFNYITFKVEMGPVMPTLLG